VKIFCQSICLIAAIFLVSPRDSASFAAEMDGVMMHDGKMMMMKAGHPATAMDHEITLSDGAIVELDGTVKSKGGGTFRLRNGEIIMMDGHLMKGGKPAAMCH
jgi:hypothetical protein